MNKSETSGIVVVDKPANMSSAQAVAAVKRLLEARKVGHAGTLDPFATGVLVCCVNQATRMAQFFLHSRKKYRALMHLGIETDTQDGTGRIISSIAPTAVTAKHLHRVIKEFEGSYWQRPPAFSALKLRGVPLYRHARRGRPVQKPRRRVEIDAIRIQDIDLPYVRFEVGCSAGTYIRTLCADIGRRLECGAHLKELRRIESGPFTVSAAASLPELARLKEENRVFERMISMAAALPDVPGIVANKSLTRHVKNGRVVKKIDLGGQIATGYRGLIKVLDDRERLLAILQQRQGSERLFYVCVFGRTERRDGG